MSKFLDAFGNLATSWQLGIGGARLRSNAGVVESRTADNSGLANFQCNALAVGTARILSVSQTAPSSPTTGDRWLELDSSNYPKYGWEWRWNGTYWLSPDFTHDHAENAVSVTTSGSLLVPNSFNLYCKTYTTNTYPQFTQSSTNYWLLQLSRATSANTLTSLVNTNSQSYAINTWTTVVNTLNLHVNISSTSTSLIRLQVFVNGSPGSTFFALQLLYNYARP